MMSNVKKRLSYVDMVRGIALLAVVLYHLATVDAVKTVCNHLIDSVLILFFFYSGYFFRPGKRTFVEKVKHRAKSLLLPLIQYGLCFWAVGTVYLLGTGVPIREALLCLRNFFAGCIWNRTIQGWFQWEYYSMGKRYLFLADFWFLIAMFFSGCLFYLIAEAFSKSRARMLLSAGGLFVMSGVLRSFHVELPYNLQLVPFWTAFLLLGAFAGQNRLFDAECLTGAKAWICAAAALAAGIALSMLKTPNLNLYRGSFSEIEAVNMLLCIAASLLIAWGLGELCRLIEMTGMNVQGLAWIGSHSLTFYLYHMFYAWIIHIVTGYPLTAKAGETAPVGVNIAVICAVLLLCAGTCFLKDRYQIVRNGAV